MLITQAMVVIWENVGLLIYGQSLGKISITVKELFPIVLALELWAEHLKNQCIVFHSDNEAVVYIINKQTSKDKALMKLVRRLVVQTMSFNIMFKAEHLSSKENDLADKLSRQDISIQGLNKGKNKGDQSFDLNAIAEKLINSSISDFTRKHTIVQFSITILSCQRLFQVKLLCQP